ncbi:MAG: AI-2E family transporter YdiK [Casimicrobiaceae bacterium]
MQNMRDLTRIELAVLLIATLIAASLWVLRPFLLATVWATMIVVATWPLLLVLQARVRRRYVAVALMTCAMLVLIVAPLFLAVQAIVSNLDTIKGWVQAIATNGLPSAPDWVRRIPVVGAMVADHWTALADASGTELVTRFSPYAADAAKWLGGEFGSFGLTAIQMLLTVLIAAILYANGELASRGVIRFGRRLAGDRGEEVVRLAGQAVRSVALGIVVTAVAQTLLAGIGLAVAGIPFASLLTALILVLCIAQVGPLPVLLPAAIWLFWNGATGWGIALIVWSVGVGSLDNFLRPALIKKGADLPLLLIFAGVLGGLLAFGIVGLFVGPVVLAVTYRLLERWVAEGDEPKREPSDALADADADDLA